MSEPFTVGALPAGIRVRYTDQITSADVVLMKFEEPALTYAVIEAVPAARIVSAPGESDTLYILCDLPQQSVSGNSDPIVEWPREAQRLGWVPPVVIKKRSFQVLWRPGQALLQCSPEQSGALIAALVEFTYYEQLLRQIENQLKTSWVQLEEDKCLAFDVTTRDLKRSDRIGERVASVLQLRMKLARTGPGLLAPSQSLVPLARKLGRRLRAAADLEARTEAANDQLGVFEGIYEMASQRMGEAKAARQTQVVEWIIIALLAGEALIALASLVLNSRA